VLLLLLPGSPPVAIVLFTLVLVLYLTAIELRDLRPHYLWWIWWLLLAVMTHFVGYLILRGYAFYRRRREAV
jgi:hypothetical protein